MSVVYNPHSPRPPFPPRRGPVLQALQALLQDCLSLGLLHLSDSTCQYFASLAVSATGLDLPRLALLLRSIGDEIGLALKRHAASDPAKLLAMMAEANALAEALAQVEAQDETPLPAAAPTAAQQSQRLALQGEHRSQYVEVGSLELAGVGAYQWEAQSGHRGLTLIFWDSQAQRFCTWSDARPGFQSGGFSPARVYRGAGPWQTASPAELSKSRLQLVNAKRNVQGRLSGSKHSQGLVRGPTCLATLDFGKRQFGDWRSLRRYVASTLPLGLAQPNPLDRLVVLQPRGWGDRQFDALSQTLEWTLFDVENATIPLRVPYGGLEQRRMAYLEAMEPTTARVGAIVAQAQLDASGLWIYPLSLLCHRPLSQPAVVNLSFVDAALKARPALQTSPSPVAQPTLDPIARPLQPEQWLSASPLHPPLQQLLQQLQSVAEQGHQRWSGEQQRFLELQVQQWQARGVLPLALGCRAVLDCQSHDPDRWHGDRAAALLRLHYLAQLTQDSLIQLEVAHG